MFATAGTAEAEQEMDNYCRDVEKSLACFRIKKQDTLGAILPPHIGPSGETLRIST